MCVMKINMDMIYVYLCMFAWFDMCGPCGILSVQGCILLLCSLTL